MLKLVPVIAPVSSLKTVMSVMTTALLALTTNLEAVFLVTVFLWVALLFQDLLVNQAVSVWIVRSPILVDATICAKLTTILIQDMVVNLVMILYKEVQVLEEV